MINFEQQKLHSTQNTFEAQNTNITSTDKVKITKKQKISIYLSSVLISGICVFMFGKVGLLAFPCTIVLGFYFVKKYNNRKNKVNKNKEKLLNNHISQENNPQEDEQNENVPQENTPQESTPQDNTFQDNTPKESQTYHKVRLSPNDMLRAMQHLKQIQQQRKDVVVHSIEDYVKYRPKSSAGIQNYFEFFTSEQERKKRVMQYKKKNVIDFDDLLLQTPDNNDKIKHSSKEHVNPDFIFELMEKGANYDKNIKIYSDSLLYDVIKRMMVKLDLIASNISTRHSYIAAELALVLSRNMILTDLIMQDELSNVGRTHITMEDALKEAVANKVARKDNMKFRVADFERIYKCIFEYLEDNPISSSMLQEIKK